MRSTVVPAVYRPDTAKATKAAVLEKEALIRPIDRQIILVTGATDGLGQAVATELARQGATLLLHGRSEKRGQRTLAQITSQTGNDQLSYYRADFDSLEEVRGLADRVSANHHRLDVLSQQRRARRRPRPAGHRRARGDLPGRLPRA